MISKSQEQDVLGRHAGDQPLAKLLTRSFVSAHLLTGDTTRAEKAVMEAIKTWNPNEDEEQDLFQITLRTAVQMSTDVYSELSDGERTADQPLPVELRQILKLPRLLRCSFVLRILIGLPSQVCAQTLHLGVPQMDDYSCEAMKTLAFLDRAELSGQFSQQAGNDTA